MRRVLATLLASTMLVGVMALPATANEDDTFVDFVVDQAEERRGSFNVIGQVVLALADAGVLSAEDVTALSTAEITAFLPTDFAFRRLAADISGERVWRVDESEVIGILTGALDLSTIGVVVKYHIYAGGKVDYRTALSLDPRRGNGTDTFITMYSGGELGIDGRPFALQLDDAGTAGLGTNNPYVIWPDIDAENALVHGISEVLLP